MTRIHAEIVLAAVVAVLVLLWVLWRTRRPGVGPGRRTGAAAVMVAQGIVGYTQYFTHLPALLVGVHVFGATMVWSAVLWFHHGLSDHAVPNVTGPGVSRGPSRVGPGAGQVCCRPTRAEVPVGSSRGADRPGGGGAHRSRRVGVAQTGRGW